MRTALFFLGCLLVVYSLMVATIVAFGLPIICINCGTWYLELGAFVSALICLFAAICIWFGKPSPDALKFASLGALSAVMQFIFAFVIAYVGLSWTGCIDGPDVQREIRPGEPCLVGLIPGLIFLVTAVGLLVLIFAKLRQDVGPPLSAMLGSLTRE